MNFKDKGKYETVKEYIARKQNERMIVISMYGFALITGLGVLIALLR